MLTKPTNRYPSYLNAYYGGAFFEAERKAFKLLESCCICPRKCGVNRVKDERGFCGTGYLPKVYSFMAHHGEEPPISGIKGSGAVFFSGCNMNCAYCQNYEFSQTNKGKEISFEKLAEYMLELQNIACHNINLVTPTHIMPQILKALGLAIPKGLRIPVVWNTSGYELPNIVKLLDGIVDIYLTDMRYGDNDMAVKYSNAKDYSEFNMKAVKEMHRQVGIANMDKEGILRQGLIVRHMVLPDGIAGTEKIMKFISQEVSKQTYVSCMSQYAPFHKANRFKELSRRITSQEYGEATQIMEKYELHNGWMQDLSGLSKFAGINIKPV